MCRSRRQDCKPAFKKWRVDRSMKMRPSCTGSIVGDLDQLAGGYIRTGEGAGLGEFDVAASRLKPRPTQSKLYPRMNSRMHGTNAQADITVAG